MSVKTAYVVMSGSSVPPGMEFSRQGHGRETSLQFLLSQAGKVLSVKVLFVVLLGQSVCVCIVLHWSSCSESCPHL